MNEQERLDLELKRLLAKFNELGALVTRLREENADLRRAVFRLEQTLISHGVALVASPPPEQSKPRMRMDDLARMRNERSGSVP